MSATQINSLGSFANSASVIGQSVSNKTAINKSATKSGERRKSHARPGSVESLVDELAIAVDSALGKIRVVNDSTRTLALNARIEAARAGQHGAAFGVVASECKSSPVALPKWLIYWPQLRMPRSTSCWH